MVMDVYTIGGGEIVYEVLKAVALCLNGGSGALQGMLRMGGVVGVFIVYYMILYGNPMEVLKNWGIPVVLLTTMVFVPTSQVYVHDTITSYHYKIDHVPYGLALFSSQTSKVGKGLTELVEQSFSTPDDMTYQKTGMLFGSDIMEKAESFKITNANFRENFRNFVGQCVKYDIMLNQKYTFDDLKNSNNLWGLITSNPSRNRGLYWIPIDGNGSTQYVTCAGAVEKFNTAWAAELDRTFSALGRKFFTGRFISKSGSMEQSLSMNPSVETALKNEIKTHLLNASAYLGNIASSAEEALQQALVINGIADAASENSKLAGNAVTYAETRALQQQHLTFATIGRLAAKLLPIMKAVIEALAYACFIFIIPLCMIPQGYKFLLRWGAVLVWLQAWPPMYAILNYIMNIAARASTLSEIGTAGGLTIGNYIGVSEANADIKLLAGYLAMSIPFICIAIVKGVGSFINLATQLTGVSMQAASVAAGESATGNFSFGNINMRNRSYDNMSQLQRNFSSSLAAGGSRVDTGGVQIINDVSGFSTYHQDASTGVTDFSATNSSMEELRMGISESEQRASAAGLKLANSQSTAKTETARIAESVSKLSAQDIQEKYGLSSEQAKNVLEAARFVDAYNKGHTYNDQTHANGGLSGGISGGISFNKGRKTRGKAAKNGKIDINAGVNGGTGVQATNSTNYGDSKQGNRSQEYAESTRTLESFAKDISLSNRSDELTQLARDHQRTLQKIDSYSHNKSYNEQKAKNFQEVYNRANSLTFVERRKLNDEAWEIGQEKGYSQDEARRIMNSHDAQDVSIRNSWLMEAQVRNAVRMSPNKPAAPTRNTVFQGYNYSTMEKAFEKEYADKEHEGQTAINFLDSKIATEKQALHSNSDVLKDGISYGVDNAKADIEQNKQQITNNIENVKQKEQERSEKGAIKAAKDKIFGNDE